MSGFGRTSELPEQVEFYMMQDHNGHNQSGLPSQPPLLDVSFPLLDRLQFSSEPHLAPWKSLACFGNIEPVMLGAADPEAEFLRLELFITFRAEPNKKTRFAKVYVVMRIRYSATSTVADPLVGRFIQYGSGLPRSCWCTCFCSLVVHIEMAVVYRGRT